MKKLFPKTELQLKYTFSLSFALLSLFSYYVLYTIYATIHDDAITLIYIPILFSIAALFFSWDLFAEKKILAKTIALVTLFLSFFTLWTLWIHVGILFISSTQTGQTIFFGICHDTDGGVNPYLKGTVTQGSKSYADSCVSSREVLEYYCSRLGFLQSEVLTHTSTPSCDYCTKGSCPVPPP